jgi:hypothetical protein
MPLLTHHHEKTESHYSEMLLYASLFKNYGRKYVHRYWRQPLALLRQSYCNYQYSITYTIEWLMKNRSSSRTLWRKLLSTNKMRKIDIRRTYSSGRLFSPYLEHTRLLWRSEFSFYRCTRRYMRCTSILRVN